jgi:multidrug efflux pump subunit AcrA (membrane-fusion protein)
MKIIITIVTLSLVLFSCSKKENNASIDDLIKSKNTKELQAKKAAIQADLTKIDADLATLEVKKDEEALVSVLTVKDTLFNHYLDIQGNVNTKQNILVQPEVPGTLVTLNVKAGQHVAAGQILGRVDDGGSSQQVANLETQYQLANTNG